MTQAEDNFLWVKELVAAGLSDYRIASLTGIHRSTVLRWRHRDRPPRSVDPALRHWRVTDAAQYCYLLGCYLGDGHVTFRPPATWVLRISCDRQYGGLIDEIRRAMDRTFPGRCSTRIHSSTAAAEIVSI
jgi:Homeodomain-like domain